MTGTYHWRTQYFHCSPNPVFLLVSVFISSEQCRNQRPLVSVRRSLTLRILFVALFLSKVRVPGMRIVPGPGGKCSRASVGKPCPPPVAGQSLNTCSPKGSSVSDHGGLCPLLSRVGVLRHMSFSVGSATVSTGELQERTSFR